MAGKKTPDIEIITPDQVDSLGVPAALPEGNIPFGAAPRKQKIRSSEVVIIVLLILLTLCCCCACLGSAAIVKSLVLWLGGLFGGSLAVPPLVF
jgi:hypothetical protein